MPIPLPPCLLFPIMNRSCQTVIFRYFIAIARLSHKPSWAGCIPAGNIKIIDSLIVYKKQYSLLKMIIWVDVSSSYYHDHGQHALIK